MSRDGGTGLRYGWTTGACATAAATAAYTALLTGEFPDPVGIDLPNDKHPTFALARELLADGAQVVAYDPVAGQQAARTVPGLELADKAIEVADGAHALVLMTEWAEFSALEPEDLRGRMAYPILVDARNALDADAFVAAGFTVAGVGRPVRTPDGRSR